VEFPAERLHKLTDRIRNVRHQGVLPARHNQRALYLRPARIVARRITVSPGG
jgi:hypothetical protein